jgi:NADH/NAD ratio-sensing transcriptional regulator Rex
MEIFDPEATWKTKTVYNFTAKELDLREQGKVVESVHMGDSLMTLCYGLCRLQESAEEEESEIK